MDRGFSTLVFFWWTGGQRFFNTSQFFISGGLVDRGFSTLVNFLFLVDWWTEVFQH